METLLRSTFLVYLTSLLDNFFVCNCFKYLIYNEKPTTKMLLSIFNRLIEHYGPQNWWPGDTVIEIMVGAVLTQATSWKNAESAVETLKTNNLLSPKSIRNLDQNTLGNLIYSSGYYNVKAKRLKALMNYIYDQFNDDIETMSSCDIETLRNGLLSIHGIGEETADDILLYALEKPVFVIDSYTKRIFSRLGLTPLHGSYKLYSDFFTKNVCLNSKLYGEYHALLVIHGSATCKPIPKCKECCLLDVCKTGVENMKSSSIC